MAQMVLDRPEDTRTGIPTSGRNMYWEYNAAATAGYQIRIGTTPGGSDILLEGQPVQGITNQHSGALPASDVYYWSVIGWPSVDRSVEWSFDTNPLWDWSNVEKMWGRTNDNVYTMWGVVGNDLAKLWGI